MHHQLQIRVVPKNLVQFHGACPNRLIGLPRQSGGLHLSNAQNIHATVHHIDAFQSRILFDEFNRTQTSLQECLGVEGFRTLVVRMPGGTVGGPYHNIKKEISSELRIKGIASLDWNCLTKDAEGAETYEAIMNNVYTYTGNKTSVVLLMHDADTKQITADTLPKVIEYYRDNGYKFVTVEEYLGRT